MVHNALIFSCVNADGVSRSLLSFHLRCYLCEVKVAPPDRVSHHAAHQIDQERHRRTADSASDVVYWDAGSPGFGVKVTPKGRKVFIVLYRTGGAGSKLRKYTSGPTDA